MVWLFQAKLIACPICSKDGKRTSTGASGQCCALAAARQLLVLTQQQSCNEHGQAGIPAVLAQGSAGQMLPAGFALMPGPLPQSMVKASAAHCCWSIVYGLMVVLIDKRAMAGKGQHRTPGVHGDVTSSRAGTEREHSSQSGALVKRKL